MAKGITPPAEIGLSEAEGMVERMYGGLGRDFVNAIGALSDAGTDPAIVVQVAQVLRDRLLLAERAHHDDDGIGMSWAEPRVSQDGGLDVINLGPNRHPTQAA